MDFATPPPWTTISIEANLTPPLFLSSRREGHGNSRVARSGCDYRYTGTIYVVDFGKQLYGSFQDSPEEQRAVLRVAAIFKPHGQYIELSHTVLALLRERMNES